MRRYVEIQSMFMLTVVACATGDSTSSEEVCLKQCWGYNFTIEDADDDDDDDGLFDVQCQEALPNSGWFYPRFPNESQITRGSRCVSPDEHEAIKAVINGIETNDLASVPQDQVELYISAVEASDLTSGVNTMSDDAYLACVDWLENEESCRPNDAAQICNSFVWIPMSDILTDLSGCTWESPTKDEVQEVDNDTGCFFPADPPTGGPGQTGGICVGDDGPGTGAADTTTTGSAPPDPFGDVTELVDCTDSCLGSCTTWECDVDQDLIDNVIEWHSVFYDEDVSLIVVDSMGAYCGPGVEIAGLDSGEASDDLADELHLQNGDVITVVNGTALSSLGRAVDQLNDVLDKGTLDMTVKRRVGSTCETIDYEVSII